MDDVFLDFVYLIESSMEGQVVIQMSVSSIAPDWSTHTVPSYDKLFAYKTICITLCIRIIDIHIMCSLNRILYRAIQE